MGAGGRGRLQQPCCSRRSLPEHSGDWTIGQEEYLHVRSEDGAGGKAFAMEKHAQ